MKRAHILLSPIFLLALLTLLINDFYLKAEFHNFVTGKLSDFAGLFVFPFFFSSLRPKLKLVFYLSTPLLFSIFKSPYSEPFISIFNSLSFFSIDRVVDYTDLLALAILPFSYRYFLYRSCHEIETNRFRQYASLSIAFISIFAFTATSFEEERSVGYLRDYSFEGTQKELVSKLRGNRNVFGIESRPTDEVMNPDYSENSVRSGEFRLNFKIDKPMCDSRALKVSFNMKEEKKRLLLTHYGTDFWCMEEPSKEMNANVEKIFREEVILHLNLKLVRDLREEMGKGTEIKLDD